MRPEIDNAEPPYCCQCGYDISNLSDDSRCPECGTTIALSTSDPLARLSRRQRQLIAFGVVAPPAFIVTGVLSVYTLAMAGFSEEAAVVAILFHALLLAAALVVLSRSVAPLTKLPLASARQLIYAGWLLQACAVGLVLLALAYVAAALTNQHQQAPGLIVIDEDLAMFIMALLVLNGYLAYPALSWHVFKLTGLLRSRRIGHPWKVNFILSLSVIIVTAAVWIYAIVVSPKMQGGAATDLLLAYMFFIGILTVPLLTLGLAVWLARHLVACSGTATPPQPGPGATDAS